MTTDATEFARPRYLVIEHPDGRQYGVLPSDFERLRDGPYAGFAAVGFEDGLPYQATAPTAPEPGEQPPQQPGAMPAQQPAQAPAQPPAQQPAQPAQGQPAQPAQAQPAEEPPQ